MKTVNIILADRPGAVEDLLDALTSKFVLEVTEDKETGVIEIRTS